MWGYCRCRCKLRKWLWCNGARGSSKAGLQRMNKVVEIEDLCEGQSGLVVHLEDLLNGIDVSCCPEVQAQVVLVGCTHDLLQKTERFFKITKWFFLHNV